MVIWHVDDYVLEKCKNEISNSKNWQTTDVVDANLQATATAIIHENLSNVLLLYAHKITTGD